MLSSHLQKWSAIKTSLASSVSASSVSSPSSSFTSPSSTSHPVDLVKLKLSALTSNITESIASLEKLRTHLNHFIKHDPKLIEFLFAPKFEEKFFIPGGSKLFAVHADILVNIMITNPETDERILKLISTLFNGNKSETLKTDPQPTADERLLFFEVQMLMKRLLCINASFREEHLNQLLNSFPYFTVASEHQFSCYFINCLSMYNYECEDGREKLLFSLLQRMTTISCYTRAPEESRFASKIDQIRRLLDIGIDYLFRFIDKISFHSSNEQQQCRRLNKLASDELFKHLSYCFISNLQQLDSRNEVNILLLYICSLNEEYGEILLNSLWSEVLEKKPWKPYGIRYLFGFLMTAKWIPTQTKLSYVCDALELAQSYARQYTASDSLEDDDCRENVEQLFRKHRPFYIICAVAFKCLTLLQPNLEEKHILKLQRLHLQSLFTCSLNPLAFCTPSLLITFTDLCRLYQLSLCQMTVQKNRRTQLNDIVSNLRLHIDLDLPFEGLQAKSERVGEFYQDFPFSDN